MLLVGENPCQNYLTKLFPRSRAKAPLALITFRCILIKQKAYKMGKNIMLQNIYNNRGKNSIAIYLLQHILSIQILFIPN